MNTFSTNMAIGMIILVVVLLGTGTIYAKISSSAKNQDVAICSQSALMASLVNNPLTQSSFVSLNCPISAKKITLNDVQKKVSTSDLQKLGYTDSQKYRLDYLMYKEVDECMQKVNYGVKPIFNRAILPSGVETYCVVCAQVEIDPKVSAKIPIGDITAFSEKYSLAGQVEPLSQKLDERKDVVNTIEKRYYTEDKQVIIYWRSPASSITKIRDFFENTPFVGGVVGFYTDYVFAVQSLRGVPQAQLANTDVDGIYIIPETDLNTISRMCDVSANSKILQATP